MQHCVDKKKTKKHQHSNLARQLAEEFWIRIRINFTGQVCASKQGIWVWCVLLSVHRKLSGGRVKLVPEVLGIWSKDFFAWLSTGCHSSHQQEALGFAGGEEISLVRSGCDALFIPSSAKFDFFFPRFFALPIHHLNLIPFTYDKFPLAWQVYTTECENHGAKLLWSKRGF